MRFGIKSKTCNDYKDIVNLDNKKIAIKYFSKKMCLDEKKLLKIYEVCLIKNKINN